LRTPDGGLRAQSPLMRVGGDQSSPEQFTAMLRDELSEALPMR
jgi:hypothetical protein